MRQRHRFLDAPVRNSWKVFVNVLGTFFLMFIFIYGLNTFSERSGTIIEITEPPSSPSFVKDKFIDGLPVMRLALGRPITYALKWHYLEGGCDSNVRAEYEQVSVKKPRTTITVETKGRDFAVGYPGPDRIERPQPAGITAGLWHYSITVSSLCANGRRPPEQKMVDFYLDLYDARVPVFEMRSALDFLTPVIHMGGQLHWHVSLYRNLPGSSLAIYSFVREDSDNKDIVMFHKPSSYKEVGAYPNADIYLDLPPQVTPGKWHMQAANVTNLPNGKVQADDLFEVTIEVKP
jgi:hypothetical protein